MKKTTLRLLSVLCALALVVGLVPALAAVPMGGAEMAETASTVEAAVPSGDSRAADAPAKLSAGEHTVWVVGDSTVCHYDPAKDDVGYYYKRMGYGDKMSEYVSADYTVNNIALSGRSSKSFVEVAVADGGGKENYDNMIANMKAGDILIIGFGHNDEKSEDATRFTSPTGDYQTAGSFAKSLYDYYVKPAKDVGAIPVVCAPIVRHHGGSGKWGNSELHVANGGSYADAAVKLGQDTNTAVVNLTVLTKELYETLDAAAANSSAKLHSWTQDRMETMDKTHINAYGAKWVAYLLAKDIVNSQDPNVSAQLKAAFTLDKGEPTAADLTAAATPGWTAPEYAPPKLPEEKSALWENYVAQDATFYGTVFGSMGGAPSKTNHLLETDQDGNMHLALKAMKGKVADGEEGFLMYFVPVPAGKTFTIQAKATFNGFVANATNPNQAAFGLMARDAIWIDKNDKGLKSDYVVAGTFGNGSANCFRRKAGKLEKPAVSSTAVTAGNSYDLKIVGNPDGYTCTFDKEPAQSGGYDYKLTAMDSEYVYVGMFVARSMDVTFSDIVLTVDDEVLCDTRPEEGELSFAVDDWTVENGVLDSITTTKSGISTDAMGFAVVYSQGQMTGIKAVRIKPGKIPVGLELKDGDTAKVFVLSKSQNAPLFECFAYPVPAAPAP